MIKRRNFVVASIISAGFLKTVFNFKKKQELKNEDNENFISDGENYIYLKRNQTYYLPEEPKAISSLFNFDVSKYRYGKSPEIKMNGQKFNGQNIDTIILTKNIDLQGKTKFILQYTGESIGWVLFIS